MHVARTMVSIAAIAVTTSGTAFGQQIGQAPAAGPERGYVAALAGAASGPPAEPVFSVEYGEALHRSVQAYASLAYFENLMRQRTRDAVTRLGLEQLTPLTGITGWELSGRDRGISFTAGAKYLVGSERVRPYVGAGAGVINLKRTITEARLGDVTAAVFNDFAVGTSDLSLAPRGITRPLGEIVGGVGIAAGSTYVDIGYRYRRAFRLADTLEFSQFSVGIGYAF